MTAHTHTPPPKYQKATSVQHVLKPHPSIFAVTTFHPISDNQFKFVSVTINSQAVHSKAHFHKPISCLFQNKAPYLRYLYINNLRSKTVLPFLLGSSFFNTSCKLLRAIILTLPLHKPCGFLLHNSA